MRPSKMFVYFVITTALIIGCAKMSDEEKIQTLLEDSPYVGEGTLRMSNDSTDVPNSSSPYFRADTFPDDVHWVRWIELPVSIVYTITITGDSADVMITSYFYGAPPGYGLFVINDFSGPIWQRTITDSIVRRVTLYRNESDDWHIVSLTAATMYTVGATPTNPISISEVRARVDSRDYEWVINSPNTLYEKDELPTFLPNDTVEVTVTLDVTGDSAWAFLHHGAGHKPGFGLRRHHRDPFYKDSTVTFSRTWKIADDSIVATPAVRHSAVDVLIWEALFGDSTAVYQARAWAIPYIVKATLDQSLPED
jgi:hypothetical protein